MTEQDKKIINLKNNIEYFKFKISTNNKYIDFLIKENEIYRKMYQIYKKDLSEIYTKEEIEVLDE